MSIAWTNPYESNDRGLLWTFYFRTCSRREINDYEHTIRITDVDSFSKAIELAVKQLPLGEKDNSYNQLGVEWELISTDITDKNYLDFCFTNDRED